MRFNFKISKITRSINQNSSIILELSPHIHICIIFIFINPMIDLLKNYKQLNNATGYLGSVRYFLAKKKLDTLFVKWLANNKPRVQQLFNEAKQGSLKSSQCPSPFFPPRVNPASTISNNSAINFANTITPPRKIQSNQPRRTSLNETYNPNLGKSAVLGKSLTIHHEFKIDTQKIPQFFFPQGKPLDSLTETSLKDIAASIFGTSQAIDDSKFTQLVQKVLSLPGYFATLLLRKYSKSQKKISKQQFMSYWKQNGAKTVHKKAFNLLLSPNKKYLGIDDFKPLLKIIMETHPGLEFLKTSPDFQQFYAQCVISRMFYMANRKNDYQMSYRQFKGSNILKSLYDIQSDSDINANRDFFCYEDFYVIYIKFWQLDTSHKFLINKEEFSKYSGYTLSRKTVERIFSQNVKKFQQPDSMSFIDFVWFIICAEDKTTKQSIQYWFKILDLDNNGIVTGYQLQYFFQEQNQRLGDMENSSTEFNYENMVCQMVDLLKPSSNLLFTLEDFQKSPKDIGVFINCLTDLNKMIANDQKDPYEDKAFRNDHPDWTEWERFVKPEYKRVEAYDDNQEGEQVINWENDDN